MCTLSEEERMAERRPILSALHQEPRSPSGIPKRFIFAFYSFIGIFMVYVMRVNLSVALVAMVNPLTPTDHNNSGSSAVACMELLYTSQYTNISTYSPPSRIDVTYDWDTKTQGLILGSFFYGYVVTQIPGGVMSEKFGAKWLFGLGVFVTAFCTVLTPVAASGGFGALVLIRVIEGLGEGVTFPAMNVLIGQWAPKMERSRMLAIINSGAAVGNVVSLALSGYISATMGWQAVFYISGFSALVWFVFWGGYVCESPDVHPRIAKEELNHIRRGQEERKHKPPIPWKLILTSKAIWALAFAHFCNNWAYYTMLTELPTYLSNILHFNLKNNGLVSAIPYVAQTCFSIGGSFIADKIRASDQCSINTIRKTFNSLAFFIPALLTCLMGYVGCQPLIIIFLLTTSMAFNGLTHSGYSVTHIDMSPEFAGTLLGLTNCIASFTGFLAPAYVGWVTSSGQTLHNWQAVFNFASLLLILGGIVYDLGCTAEPQHWGSYNAEKTDKDSDCEADWKTDCEAVLIVDCPR